MGQAPGAAAAAAAAGAAAAARALSVTGRGGLVPSQA